MPIKLGCAAIDPSKAPADILAIGITPDQAKNPASCPLLVTLDKLLLGVLFRQMTQAEFAGKSTEVLGMDTIERLPARRILLIGRGTNDPPSTSSLRTFAALAARTTNAANAATLSVAIPEPVDPEQARALAEGIVLGAYRYNKYFTGERKPKARIERATVLAKGKLDAIRPAVAMGQEIATCICRSRDLTNQPPNELIPARLAVHAQAMATERRLACTVFDRNALQREGMRLILAVGQGSTNEPRLVHLTYTPKTPNGKRFVIVGKGLTFDSGGLCIKPTSSMDGMKSDMAGAANVIGFMEAVSIIAPDVEVHGVIAAAENMPDGKAFRPGDIYTSLDGRTVEIVNTDAEGRLVLADALAYARKLEPTVLLCNATLTGACIVALGQRCSGFFATNEDLATRFAQAARESGEQFWLLPLLWDLREQLNSNVADMKHTGERWGGTITAALFLAEFAGKVPFIHCDIAGPAFAEKAHGIYPKGGTGHGVLAFLRFLELL